LVIKASPKKSCRRPSFAHGEPGGGSTPRSPRCGTYSIDNGREFIAASRARSVRAGVAPVVDVSIADNIDELLRSWVVEEALRRLTEPHRRAVVEVYYRGRSAADVAAELGVPAATIRSRLFYGLRALRLSLDELGWDDA
jgi:RNA polymerase sigma-70 factor (ECF subfamily)